MKTKKMTNKELVKNRQKMWKFWTENDYDTISKFMDDVISQTPHMVISLTQPYKTKIVGVSKNNGFKS